MRPSVNDANKYLRQTVKSVEAGGVATLARAMEHPGILQEIHVTTLDASDAEIPAAAGLSAGVKLPTRIESKNLVIVGKFPVATQAEYNALSDAMKDQSVIVTVDEAPIGSELKAYATDALGNVVGCTKWIMGPDGWTGAGGLTPSGSTLVATDPIVAPGFPVRSSALIATPDLATMFRTQRLAMIGSSTTEHCSKTTGIMAGTTGFIELDDGPLAAGKSRFGLPLDLVYNGAVGGTSSEQIYATHATMLAANPGVEWHWLQFGAIDMQNGSITAQACFDSYARPATLASLAAGARVILVIPHTTATATPARIANVIEYERLCRNLADAYPGRVVIWSLFKFCSAPFGGVTPALLLDTANGVHLSVEGAWVGGQGAEEIAQYLAPITYMSPKRFGTPLNSDPDCLNASSLTLVNATAALAPRSLDGRGGIDITASAAGVVFARADANMDPGKIYRGMADIEVLTDGVTEVNCQLRGVNTPDILAQIGGAVWNTSEVNYVGTMPIGSRRYLFASRALLGATSSERVYAKFTATGAGAKIRVRSIGVVEIPAP